MSMLARASEVKQGHPSGRRGQIRTWVRVVAVLVNALATAVFASLFAWVWTDELVDGNHVAYDDLAGTWWEGAVAGVGPIVVGLWLCVVPLLFSGLTWWWPVLLVLASGSIGAALGATERFPLGLPHGTWALCGTLLLGGLAGLLVNALTVHRAARHPIDA